MGGKFDYLLINPLLFQQSVYSEIKYMNKKLDFCLSALAELAELAGGSESLKSAHGIDWGKQKVIWDGGRTKFSRVCNILHQLGGLLKESDETEKYSLPGKMN